VDDVQRLGGSIVERLAATPPDTGAFRFDASSVLSLPPSATSDSIVMTRAHHDYGGYWRADALHLHAARQTVRALGVIVFASLFAAPGTSTDITLSHPASDIRTLRIRASSNERHNLALAPLWYDYRPSQHRRHPWNDDGVDPYELPAVYLTDHEELGGLTDARWLTRDTVVGFGTAQAVARFGQFLLDIGDPGHIGDEYHLEGEAGVRGVAPMSAELSLWLPGSFGWEPDHRLG
jgi:hypothetical protein